MASWTGKKSNIVFSRKDEPSFLKKFKERVGYKEDQGVKAKFEKMPQATSEDYQDGEDEQPQVVQLKSGDLSKEEYDKLKSNGEACNSEEACFTEDGRIKFNKSRKRLSEDNELKSSTKKVKESEKDKTRKDVTAKKKKKEANRKLLSFDEED